jgi:hypothetical protein
MFALAVCSGMGLAQEEAPLETQFRQQVLPLVEENCLACHSSVEPEGKLDLTRFKSASDVAAAHSVWQAVLERLEAKEMPPEDAERQPTAQARAAAIAWIRAFRKFDAARNASDPGIVPARRLSNAEYNNTIRDLTGVDIRPAKDFPVDPANEAGFDNSGESLAMSPALANKYVEAARFVAEHLVLKPRGISFAPHPAQTDTDRDKYCVRRIVDFYQRQPTDYVAYFQAAWRYRHRTALGQPAARLEDVAREAGVSPKYLRTVWSALNDERFELGPMGKLQAMWQVLPKPTQPVTVGTAHPASRDAEVERPGCLEMRDFVVILRRKLEPPVKGLKVQGIHEGSQCFVLWKNRQYAANRRTYNKDALQIERPEQPAEDKQLAVPADETERAKFEESFARFAEVFPDAFYISERGRDYVGKPRELQEKGRLLSAGFHSMMGYFRDDGPLYDMVLDDEQQVELDELWQELDFIANAPARQHIGFLWFERTDSRYLRDPEFDFSRPEHSDCTSEEKITRLVAVYLAKAIRNGASDVAIEAIERHFRDISSRIRWVEQARVAAEPTHLAALVDFAERAFRRPLTETERGDFLSFYRSLRSDPTITHEEAIQDVLVSILLSPRFCYRMDLVMPAGGGQRALDDFELASRLSYFLWASMPDAELLACAKRGELRQPAVLLAQARRMMRDEKIRGLALEFGGNWLEFRRFDQHNSVDRERFPTFTNELREAMFEEPARFFVDLAHRDGSVLDFLYAKHTFVNGVLAEHYDVGDITQSRDQWSRIEDATSVGRGGLLPMAAFLTQNAPGLRTSPVKRGYWVARRLLGERIPAPPPNVPELPADEAKLELSLRETLAQHRDHASCRSCHERFDSLGLVFEGYGPIGERREHDLAGRPVDTAATFPGGSEGAGIDGLRRYLKEHREQDFLDNLCRKLLSYALGRTLLPSDDGTVSQMRERLTEDGHRFGTLVETIVVSPQFLTKRATGPIAKDRTP